MSIPQNKRRPNGNEDHGNIRGDVAYTREGMIALGYGDETLSQIRRDGVRPRQLGRRDVYLGSELLKWIESK